MRLGAAAGVAAVVAVMTALAGCGIPADRDAREIEGQGSGRESEFPAVPSVESGSVSQRLFLVRDEALVTVVRWVPSQPTVDALVHDLVTGPTAAERARGMTSAVLGTDVVGPVRLAGGQATVQLATGSENVHSDEVLALGQLVCTLDSHPRVDGVSFVRDGKRVSVPRGDGTLSAGPLTTADYANLVAG